MIYRIIAFVLGYTLDLVFGDPIGLPHPVIYIGKLISFLEQKFYNKNLSEKDLMRRGKWVLIITAIVCWAIAYVILGICYTTNIPLGVTVEGIMCYYILATKSLKTESMKVSNALKTGTLDDARKVVSRIVGRDTNNLTKEGVIKATVETVAENTSDGVIAPMIFIALGGAPLGWFYKACNTMDSMIGYKNEKYFYFGRYAAKFDDILNYIPARISAFIMMIGSSILGFNTKGAFKIWKRDRYNHASPNSAQTEAVMAGALNIQLAGDAYYFGKLCKKKTIGDDIRKVEIEDISKSTKLLYMTSVLMMILILAIKILVRV